MEQCITAGNILTGCNKGKVCFDARTKYEKEKVNVYWLSGCFREIANMGRKYLSDFDCKRRGYWYEKIIY